MPGENDLRFGASGSDDFLRIAKAMEGVNDSMKEMLTIQKNLSQVQQQSATASRNAAGSTNRMTSSMRQANTIMFSLGQGAQDLQFGLLGVGNNISFLSEQFVRFFRSSRSLDQAFRSLASAFFGAGGLILALNLLISFGPKIMDFFRGASEEAEEFKKRTEEAAEAILEIDTTVQGVKFDPADFVPAIEEAKNRITNLRTELNQLLEPQKELNRINAEIANRTGRGAQAPGAGGVGLAQLQAQRDSLRDILSTTRARRDAIDDELTRLERAKTSIEEQNQALRDQLGFQKTLVSLGGEIVEQEEQIARIRSQAPGVSEFVAPQPEEILALLRRSPQMLGMTGIGNVERSFEGAPPPIEKTRKEMDRATRAISRFVRQSELLGDVGTELEQLRFKASLLESLLTTLATTTLRNSEAVQQWKEELKETKERIDEMEDEGVDSMQILSTKMQGVVSVTQELSSALSDGKLEFSEMLAIAGEVLLVMQRIKNVSSGEPGGQGGKLGVFGSILQVGSILAGVLTGLPAFAEGGAVTGSTLALVGERSSPSNPEVIAPFNKLQGMMGGNGRAMERAMTNALRKSGWQAQGRDLLVVTNQAEQNEQRF